MMPFPKLPRFAELFWEIRVQVSGRFRVITLLGLATALIPNRALAQRPLGVDVSDYQGTTINWTSVKGAGIVFGWSKATEGASGQYVSQASFTGNQSNGK